MFTKPKDTKNHNMGQDAPLGVGQDAPSITLIRLMGQDAPSPFAGYLGGVLPQPNPCGAKGPLRDSWHRKKGVIMKDTCHGFLTMYYYFKIKIRSPLEGLPMCEIP